MKTKNYLSFSVRKWNSAIVVRQKKRKERSIDKEIVVLNNFFLKQ